MLRDGDAALLVNLGDGSMLEELKKRGVKNVEWILFTDHHGKFAKESASSTERLRKLRLQDRAGVVRVAAAISQMASDTERQVHRSRGQLRPPSGERH